MWSGVQCLDGKVDMLDLDRKSLRGALDPALGDLSYLRSLVLSKNQFFGGIPKRLGLLSVLEVLDLRDNNLSGTLPAEIGELQSLKRLLLSNNYFIGSIPSEIEKLNSLCELQLDESLTSSASEGILCVNRKFGHCIWQGNFKPQRGVESLLSPFKGAICRSLHLFQLFKYGKDSMHSHFDNLICSTEPHIIQPAQTMVNSARRRLAEQSSNLAATPVNGGYIFSLPSSRSSGAFPAVSMELSGPESPALQPSPPPQGFRNASSALPSIGGKSDFRWKYTVGITIGVFLLLFPVLALIICRSRAAKAIGPWKTGLSGQLQKAFVTGVPKLNRVELEQACEDFSNIISTHEAYTLYKGTLSSGVEIGVASTAITSKMAWKRRTEVDYRKKIASLSRVNHKNFVNLIGYLEENEPFARMMVFEYAPNGTLYEHLHVKEAEHLDWSSRMRIIMGTAYCLQYMHELKPPLPHSHLISRAIYLTEDYAAKVAEISFWSDFVSHSKKTFENSEYCQLPALAHPETNVYDFGLLLLEIISGKLPNSKEQGPILKWAEQYLNDNWSSSCLIDPSVKSFKDNELDIICEVIKQCIQPDVRKRPSIQEVIAQLRKVLDISPDAATPRLSPLWWAELEILSAEAP
ncbi:hypothetical protein Leryth_010997 [Lithospermum erythrorhizon]|nr:hypothetical protein Leryth_010997 [Lithospermum erythrorhizon]